MLYVLQGDNLGFKEFITKCYLVVSEVKEVEWGCGSNIYIQIGFFENHEFTLHICLGFCLFVLFCECIHFSVCVVCVCCVCVCVCGCVGVYVCECECINLEFDACWAGFDLHLRLYDKTK